MICSAHLLNNIPLFVQVMGVSFAVIILRKLLHS